MNFTLHDLEKRVQERAQASPDVSYTRRLIDRGVAHCAKKLGEEAIETVLAAASEDRERLIAEAADLIYHLLVVLEMRGIRLADVEAALAERAQRSLQGKRPARKGARGGEGPASAQGPAPFPLFPPRAGGGGAGGHADDAHPGRGEPGALAQRSPRHEGGRGDLPAAVAPTF